MRLGLASAISLEHLYPASEFLPAIGTANEYNLDSGESFMFVSQN
jgi:hypothetical protein